MDTLINIYKIGGYDNIGKNRSRTITVYSGTSEFRRSIGDECTFQIRDIILNAKYIDFKKDKEHVLSEVSSMFKLRGKSYDKINEEMKNLLSLSNEKLAQIYVNRFRLYSVFSDTIRPLFMAIREYFENQIKILCSNININITSYIKKWEEYDRENNINSSSVILYQLGKDKDFLEELKIKYDQKQHINTFIEYVSDTNRWNYKGYCPYEPVKRMKLLLAFPLNEIFDILSAHDKSDYVDKQKKKINQLYMGDLKVIPIPYNIDLDKLSDSQKMDYISDDESSVNATPNPIFETTQKLICKLHDVKPILEKWEEYYIETSKIFSELGNRFNKIMSNE